MHKIFLFSTGVMEIIPRILHLSKIRLLLCQMTRWTRRDEANFRFQNLGNVFETFQFSFDQCSNLNEGSGEGGPQILPQILPVLAPRIFLLLLCTRHKMILAKKYPQANAATRYPLANALSTG